jgi:prepilin-type N-terminal cleavage/methylation domain-containing protein
MTAAPSRKGFTLVELLVVTGLLASLLSLVIVAMRPTEDSQIRQTANALASAIMQTQTKAVAQANGSALTFPMVSSTAGVTAASFADLDPAIIAATDQAFGFGPSQGMPPTNLTSTGTFTTIRFLTPQNAETVRSGYQIRFREGPAFGPWFSFVPTGDLVGQVFMRSNLGQTPATTLWPAGPTPASPIDCEIARSPRSSQQAAAFPKIVAIDPRYSSVGDDLNADVVASGISPLWSSPLLLQDSFASIAARNGSPLQLSLQFERTGGLSTVIPVAATPAVPPTPVRPTVPVYFLVATVSDIVGGKSLLSPTSTWVAISPLTGRVTVGKNVPTPAPNDSSAGKEQLPSIYRKYFRSLRVNTLPANYEEPQK